MWVEQVTISMHFERKSDNFDGVVGGGIAWHQQLTINDRFIIIIIIIVIIIMISSYFYYYYYN